MENYSRVLFLEEAVLFIDNLDFKTRNKVFYVIRKVRYVRNPELFKHLGDGIWEFRVLFNRQSIRLFAFWDKENNSDTLIIATHGINKKTNKTPGKEIEKTKIKRIQYFNSKNK